MGLLDLMVAPFLSFWGNSTLFSLVFVLVYIPMNHAHELPSLSILTSCYPLSTWSQSFWHMWGGSSLWFWLNFPDDYLCWAPFHGPTGHLNIFFGKSVYLLFCYWVVRVPYFFNINLLSDMWFTNIFFHSVGYLFILLFSLLYYRSFSVWCSLPF